MGTISGRSYVHYSHEESVQQTVSEAIGLAYYRIVHYQKHGQFESSPEWLINKRVHIYCTNPRIKSPKFNKWHWFAFYGNGIGKKTLTFLWLRSLFIILYTPLHLHTHRWLACLKRVLCHVETSLSMYKGKHVPLFRVAKSSRPSKNWLNRI